ncbi:hypothetical protein D3C84_692580 [compost metagenome]
MVKPPSSAKTRDGLWIPSFSLNQSMVELPIEVMASLICPAPAINPLTRPLTIMLPNSVKRVGRSTPR